MLIDRAFFRKYENNPQRLSELVDGMIDGAGCKPSSLLVVMRELMERDVPGADPEQFWGPVWLELCRRSKVDWN